MKRRWQSDFTPARQGLPGCERKKRRRGCQFASHRSLTFLDRMGGWSEYINICRSMGWAGGYPSLSFPLGFSGEERDNIFRRLTGGRYAFCDSSRYKHESDSFLACNCGLRQQSIFTPTVLVHDLFCNAQYFGEPLVTLHNMKPSPRQPSGERSRKRHAWMPPWAMPLLVPTRGGNFDVLIQAKAQIKVGLP